MVCVHVQARGCVRLPEIPTLRNSKRTPSLLGIGF